MHIQPPFCNATELIESCSLRFSLCDRSAHSHPTSVIQEEPERALDAVEEAIDDHVVDVLHVGLPLLGGVLASEQLQVSLRHDKTRRTH